VLNWDNIFSISNFSIVHSFEILLKLVKLCAQFFSFLFDLMNFWLTFVVSAQTLSILHFFKRTWSLIFGFITDLSIAPTSGWLHRNISLTSVIADELFLELVTGWLFLRAYIRTILSWVFSHIIFVEGFISLGCWTTLGGLLFFYSFLCGATLRLRSVLTLTTCYVLLKSLIVHIKISHRLLFDPRRRSLKALHEFLIVQFEFILYAFFLSVEFIKREIS
jgi:hypothetical protein